MSVRRCAGLYYSEFAALSWFPACVFLRRTRADEFVAFLPTGGTYFFKLN
jgi:hypothetical protein